MLHLSAINRFQAFGLHIAISMAIGCLGAVVVFLVWYPGVLAYASNVTTIFLMLLGIDITLGPVITLIIYDTKKKELRRDLLLVSLLQFSALCYGLHTMFVARPVYIVYNAGQFDVAYANDITQRNLDKVTNVAFKKNPVFSPELVSVQLPDDPAVIAQIIKNSITGGPDPYYQPEYYVPYLQQRKAILEALKPMSKLTEYNANNLVSVNRLIEKYRSLNQDVGYLVVKARAHNVTAIVDRQSANLLEISAVNPLP